ncbi:hypothetical protein FSP39_007432 [Pinctada imbricata]|uniref:Plasminogen n=1 Tax=Pinctada imbricata TaxID=66713 RepID=A0AA89C6W9_PINIB|nr:hypothetical protein FSP39_007432 [Pinctada imbricata]
MPWASSNPHSHRFTYVKGQFCRNPDNEPRTWCYTTDPEVRYEFCNVTACETTNSTCYENSRERPYSGTINITVTGYPCQRWDSQSPNRHTFTDVSEENYCRTPDGAVVPWCYSTNPTKRWEECQIVPCEKSATVYGCYEGWEDYGGNCYKIEKNMSTWREADSACKKMDSELTSILTGEEQQFILGIMSADLCFNTRKLSDCKKWADQGDCVKDPLFMIQYCRQSCDHEVFCNTDCAMDAHENSAQCGRWQTSGECARNPLWMLSHCAYSCQVCSNGNIN